MAKKKAKKAEAKPGVIAQAVEMVVAPLKKMAPKKAKKKAAKKAAPKKAAKKKK